MWIPAHTTLPPLATRPSESGTSSPTGAKTMAASSSSGGRVVRAAGPFGAELAREGLSRLVARPREREDAPALLAGDLRDDVRGCAEADEADALGVTREAEGRGSR